MVLFYWHVFQISVLSYFLARIIAKCRAQEISRQRRITEKSTIQKLWLSRKTFRLVMWWMPHCLYTQIKTQLNSIGIKQTKRKSIVQRSIVNITILTECGIWEHFLQSLFHHSCINTFMSDIQTNDVIDFLTIASVCSILSQYLMNFIYSIFFDHFLMSFS